jgi:peptidoglycan/LPS O-acetylase OafA/YrhL
MILEQASIGRDNNFNLLRMVAASAVLVTHSFALQSGNPRNEPLEDALGMSLGGMSVDVFFVASGFLVTASMLKRKSISDFARARILRIYPAALVMCVLTVFLLGPLATTVGVIEYFQSLTTWKYFAKCATLVAGVSFELPGVFASNPYPKAVNGSLWSMPWELRMYLLLVALWGIACLGGSRREQWFRFGVVAFGVIGLILGLAQEYVPFGRTEAFRLLAMFFIGGTLHVFASRISLRLWIGVGASALLLGAGLAGPHVFPAVWMLVAPYLVLWFAYVPGGFIRRYNHVGDYSYGTYIFAFPLQQLVMMLKPDASVLTLTLLAGLGTLVFAMLSWHFIEKPCMALLCRKRPSNAAPTGQLLAQA